MEIHLHRFEINSDFFEIHKHKVYGYVRNIFGIQTLHIHFYYGISSCTGHSHSFSGITSAPIKTQNGHIHKISGLLENNKGHEHKFKGYTFEDVSYITGLKSVAQRT